MLGPVRNGGIGTACTYLAYHLAKSGHNVSILFTQSPSEANPKDSWLREYQKRNIRVILAEWWLRTKNHGDLPEIFPNHRPLLMARTVYQWLAEKEIQERPFDIVIFMEWQGSGFYALHAKRTTPFFQKTAFVVQIHSPSIWHSVNNADMPKYPEASLTWYMERKSVEMADAVVSPSQYMLDWCKNNGYVLPNESRMIPNLLEFDPKANFQATLQKKSYIKFAPDSDIANESPLQELVFFGRLEYRKGLVQFCNAVDILVKQGTLPQKITFMGKLAWVGNEHAALYIARRTESWSVPISLLTDYDHEEALRYLSDGKRLAIMPSVADNSPYTVYECLKLHIPFVARKVGGIPELIPAEAQESCLCSDRPASLAEKMQKALTAGIPCPGLAFDEKDVRKQWLTWLDDLKQQAQQTKSILPNGETHPKVSVCLTHHDRPDLLRQAVDSLLAQNYPNFEIILADDGSTSLEALRYLNELEPLFAARGWKILRLENGFPGRARNISVQESTGSLLLFFDDDNIARPDMLSQFVCATQHSRAEMIVSIFDTFDADIDPRFEGKSKNVFLPLGGILSYSCLTNVISDTTALISKRLFEQLGGFTEDYGVGHEDFELWLKAVLAGVPIAILPESLFWYRWFPEQGVQRGTNIAANRMRSFRPFLTHASADIAELAAMAHGAVLGKDSSEDRILAAPTLLSLCEKELFANSDPNAFASLIAIIRELRNQGQRSMREDLLTVFARNQDKLSHKERLFFQEASILEALEKSKNTDPAQAVRQFESMNPDENQRTRFYLEIFPRCAGTSLQKELCAKIVTAKNVALPLQLAATQMLLDAGYLQEGKQLFAQAMNQAEELYLERRPDVRKGIQRKEFTCALQHYQMYGKNENTAWPEEERFVQLFKKYQQIT